MLQYFDYQQTMHNDIFNQYAVPGTNNVCAVLPTGGGKTVVMSGVVNAWERGQVCCIAHRKELVGQIALALGQNGVKHKIIGPRPMVKYVINRQKQRLGTHFFDANAPVTVASVDTLIAPSRKAGLKSWAEQVGLWVIDECHHVVRKNKWGKATEMFTNARGLGFTATPVRADGLGLGRHADGIMDSMVEGPTMRELIDAGRLCDYRIFAPLTYMPLQEDKHRASGDYSTAELKAASKSSPIVGDVVDSYMKYAQGLQAVVFATDLETAANMSIQYNAAGITTEVISSNTKDTVRSELLDRFEKRDIKVIINVDLLGEGFDCPGIECVLFARPTQSYGLYCQQFGRALRTLDGKEFAIVIDHVGNVVRHGLPDAARVWDLDGRGKTPSAANSIDEIPLRYCPSCTQPYARYMVSCPYCGHSPAPDARGRPEFVDGDVYEMSPEMLAELRGAIAVVDTPADVVRDRMLRAGAPGNVAGRTFNNVTARKSMQDGLRVSMNWWAGKTIGAGFSEREAYRIFYHTFGIDALSATALNRADAEKLANKINYHLGGPQL